MFCGRALDRLINRLHQRALRSAYEDSECSYKELLSTDGSIAVHQRNLRVLAVEIYKLTKKLSPEFMWDMVEEVNTKYIALPSCKIDINENDEISTHKSLCKTKTTIFDCNFLNQ